MTVIHRKGSRNQAIYGKIAYVILLFLVTSNESLQNMHGHNGDFEVETYIEGFVITNLVQRTGVTSALHEPTHMYLTCFVVRRAGLLWSQQDFEWRWSVPLFKCLTVLEFPFSLFDLCLLITFFNFIMNYVPIVTFWIFTYHKIWILSIMFCFIWSYWIIYFLACLEVSWRVVS